MDNEIYNQIHFSVKCDSIMMQDILEQGAVSIVISGTMPMGGTPQFNVYGMSSENARIEARAKGSGTCPMPC
jgi:hypothetical protein